MVTLDIEETVIYKATGTTVYDAMKAFLNDPNHHLVSVEERFIQTLNEHGRGRDLTIEEMHEITQAEEDS